MLAVTPARRRRAERGSMYRSPIYLPGGGTMMEAAGAIPGYAYGSDELERSPVSEDDLALRHTSAKKNQTDAVEAPERIPLRYMVAFVYPITATVREFLAKKGHSEEEVDAMHQAWFKAVTLSVVLWSRPYAGDGW